MLCLSDKQEHNIMVDWMNLFSGMQGYFTRVQECNIHSVCMTIYYYSFEYMRSKYHFRKISFWTNWALCYEDEVTLGILVKYDLICVI